jgi:transcriptional regulator with XRE-family HTH domain
MGKITVDPRPGQRLREVRQHREISPANLAKAIGVSVGTIQHYEHGRTRITDNRLDQLAQALSCGRLELLMPPGSPPPPY